jgi:hypothetical protein
MLQRCDRGQRRDRCMDLTGSQHRIDPDQLLDP